MLRATIFALTVLMAPNYVEAGWNNDCGNEHARYEMIEASPSAGVNIGDPIWVLRKGTTRGAYLGKGSSIAAVVYEVTGGPDRHAFLHGPIISSLFIDYKDLPNPVEWVPNNDSLPSQMRVMENNGTNMIVTIKFSRCQKSPYKQGVAEAQGDTLAEKKKVGHMGPTSAMPVPEGYAPNWGAPVRNVRTRNINAPFIQFDVPVPRPNPLRGFGLNKQAK